MSSDNLITIYEAAKLIKAEYQSAKYIVEENNIEKIDIEGKTFIDKIEFLSKIPTAICFYNKKGGSGKTTTSKIIADYFDKLGKKILIIDLDPQSNLSFSYFKYSDIVEKNIDVKKYKFPTLYNYFEENTPLNKIVKKYNNNIDILISDIRLDSKISIDTIQLFTMKKEFKVVMNKYQIIIIDCPPSFNALSRLGMLLCNYIFCPVLAEKYSYDGVDEALEVIKMIKDHNKDFVDFWVFLSKHEWQKTNVRDFIEITYRDELKEKFMKNFVPNNISIVESQFQRKNIFDYKGDFLDKVNLYCNELVDNIYKLR